MWAHIPEGTKDKFDNVVMAINSQVPEDYPLLVIQPDAGKDKGKGDAAATRAREALGTAFSAQKGQKFHQEHIQVGFMRTIPGHGYYVSDFPWETHPQYTGPADQRIYVYNHRLASEKIEAANRLKAQEEAKAKIQATADAKKAAIDGTLPSADPEVQAAVVEPAPAAAPAKGKKSKGKS